MPLANDRPFSFEARLYFTLPPGEPRWKALMAITEAMVENNSYWLGKKVQDARHLEARGLPAKFPPCCIACAKDPPFKYVKPPPGKELFCQKWRPASEVLASRRVGCLGAAMYDAAMARVEGKQAYAYLEPMGNPVFPNDEYSTLDFHAVAIVNGERRDSTALLESVKASKCGCC